MNEIGYKPTVKLMVFGAYILISSNSNWLLWYYACTLEVHCSWRW